MDEVVAEEIVGERFVLEERVGEGGMAVVWRARDLRTGEPVAIKLLAWSTARSLERLEREARVLETLGDIGVARYIAHGVHRGTGWIAMEHVVGLDLDELLAQRRLDLDEVRRLAMRVVATLTRAHELGIIHRDIKPANLFVTGGRVEDTKILDFGMARVTDAVRVTDAGAIVGTPAFMAPEQARGNHEIDARADLFALGCVLFECLTGTRAFVGDTPLAILTKVIFDIPPSVRMLRTDVPEALVVLVADLLEKDPANRPASALEVLERMAEIGEITDGEQRITMPDALTEREQRWVGVVLATAPSSRDADIGRLLPELRAEGVRVERVQDGSVAVLVLGASSPVASAEDAARAGLRILDVVPDSRVSLATGRAVIGEALPIGAVIDRAVATLEEVGPGLIGVDGASVELLAGSFDIVTAGARATLVRERDEGTGGTICIGREHELALADSFWTRCAAGEPDAWLLIGPSGIGKSCVLDEVVGRIASAEPMPLVLFVAATLASRDRAFSVLAQLVRLSVGDGPALGPLTQRLADPLAATFLAEVLGESVHASPELVSARADPLLMQARVGKAAQTWLSAECARRPVLVVIDDVQWADASSLRALRSAIHSLGSLPLGVLFAGRPEAADARDLEGIEATALGPLSAHAADRLLRERVRGVDEDTLANLLKIAEGSPLFLEQLALGAPSGAVAESVLGMIEMRLGELDKSARRVLRAASVFGVRFTRDGVADLLGGVSEAGPIDAELTELLARELVIRVPGALAFKHQLLRDAAYAMLTDEDRRAAHRKAADWLVENGADDPLALAAHYEAAELGLAAVPLLLDAASRSFEGNELEAARRLAARAIEAGARAEQLGRAERIRAEAWQWQTGHAEAARHAELALAHLEEGSSEWFLAMRTLVSALGPTGAVDEIVAWSRRHAALRNTATPDPVAWSMAGCALALQLTSAGRYEAADVVLAQVGDASEITQEPRLVAYHAYASAFRAVHASAFAEAVGAYEKAVALYESLGDVRTGARARSSLGYVQTELGLLEEADEVLSTGLERAQELGLETARHTLLHNLGHARARLGRHVEAVAIEEEAIDALERIGNVRLAGGSCIYLAESLTALGRFDDAHAALDRAEQLASRFPPMQVPILAQRALLLLEEGEPAKALEVAERAKTTLEATGGVEEGAVVVSHACIEALLACDRRDDATAAATVVRESLLRRAAALADERLRNAFLTRVPHNASVLRRAFELGVS